MRTLTALLTTLLLLLAIPTSSYSTPNSCPNPPTVPSLTLLPTNDKMPTVGFGCWKLGSQTSTIIENAISVGYRHIDSAADYGNEKQVGLGIKNALKNMNFKRSDLFITSKLWNTFHYPDHVELGVRKTLEDLGVDYLDLYLIHFPISLKYVPIDVRYPPQWIHDPKEGGMLKEETGVTIHETWKAMENLVHLGLVKNIGLANFPAALLLELLKTCKIKPANIQIEIHPKLSQRAYVDFLHRLNITVTGFSPLGSIGYCEIGMDRGEGVNGGLLTCPAIVKLAEKYGRNPAQIMLKWGVQRGIAVIPKTTHLSRMQGNLDIFDFSLSLSDMEIVFGLNENKRYNDPGVFCRGMDGDNDYPIYL